MSMSRRSSRRTLCSALATLLAACGGASTAMRSPNDSGLPNSQPTDGGSAAGDSGAVTGIRADVRAMLATLTYSEVPPAPPDISNRWADDPEAASFGRRLFFETGFSGRLLDGDNDGSEHALGRKGEAGRISCAGCHVPRDGFSDTRSLNRQISLGAGWVLRRTPSLLDVSRNKLYTWVARRDALYNQPLGPLESALEMNSSRLFVAQQVFKLHKAEYERLFGALPPLADPARFPPLSPEQTGCSALDADNKCKGAMRGAPGDGAEFDALTPGDQQRVNRVVVNVGKAIGAYLRLLNCGVSRFDRWMAGDSAALDATEQRGAELFVTKGKCNDCHNGPFLSDEKFHNVGLRPALVASVFVDLGDDGAHGGLTAALTDPLNTRGEFSDGDDDRLPREIDPAHLGAFQTPRLRCVADRPSFMHTAQLRSLEEVVDFFNLGGSPAGFPGKNELAPLDLSLEERAQLVAFLKTLTGDGPPPQLLAAP
jgi:cytochrome c peroxidase